MTREEFVDRWSQGFPGLAEEPFEFVRALNALLEAERAKAREEQREVDARYLEGAHRTSEGNCNDAVRRTVSDGRTAGDSFGTTCGNCLRADMVRSSPTTSTPLADRIAELERERDEARALIRNGAQIAHALTLETQTPEEWTTDLARQVREARQQLCQHLVTVERLEALEAFGGKVNAIRDSIVGAQALNWSEHAYPLVAALDAAGFVGLPYPEARANLGTLLERLATAERERDEARAEAKESAASDMDSLQRLKAVEPALERARIERGDAERARDAWKARALKAEEALAEMRDQADAVEVERWSARP